MSSSQLEPHIGLVVEDDPAVRALAVALLEESELDVVEVESADAALTYRQERGGEVALIFAGVRLPGIMDGVQLAKAVDKLWPTIRIVLTSGAASTSLDGLPESVTLMPKLGVALTCSSKPRRRFISRSHPSRE
jgi:CheY-like chemotaxis protein